MGRKKRVGRPRKTGKSKKKWGKIGAPKSAKRKKFLAGVRRKGRKR